MLELPFKIVEHPTFNSFPKRLEPKVHIDGCKAIIGNDCVALFEEKKGEYYMASLCMQFQS